MGFSIGWKYFEWDDYYSERAVVARNRAEAQAANKRRSAEKQRRKRALKKKLAKQKMRDETYKEQTGYQDQLNNLYGAGDPFGYGQDENDPSSLFNKFGSQAKDAYRDETARRYGYLYTSYSDDETPGLDRGMGAGPHQGVSRSKNVKHHSPLGPFARRIRVRLGDRPHYDPLAGPNSRDIRAEADAKGGAADTKLSRPL